MSGPEGGANELCRRGDGAGSRPRSLDRWTGRVRRSPHPATSRTSEDLPDSQRCRTRGAGSGHVPGRLSPLSDLGRVSAAELPCRSAKRSRHEPSRWRSALSRNVHCGRADSCWVAVLLALLPPALAAKPHYELTGRVVAIADGDTLTILD